MPSEEVFERVVRWSSGASGAGLPELHEYLDYLAHHVFVEYEPTSVPGPDFWTRCREWLDCAPTEKDQRLLLTIVRHLAFVTRGEFYALYRDALREQIVTWLVTHLGLRLDDLDIASQVENALATTWFCGITDSMGIAGFYHVNRISGVEYRPDWRSLAELCGDPTKLVSYMQKEGLQRLVLLEDFVGSGDQMIPAVEFAAHLPGTPPVLVVPLIVCPKGIEAGDDLAARLPNVTFSPVTRLPPEALVTRPAAANEPTIYREFRDLAERLAGIVPGAGASALNTPLGYRGTGSLVVLFANTPDNTLPLIHRTTKNWSPVFPRSSRG